MASNRDLQADIEALSKELGVSTPEGLLAMKNPKLVETLEALQARRAGLKSAEAGGESTTPRGLTMPTAVDAVPPAAPALDAEQAVINLERGAAGTVAPQVAHRASPSAAMVGALSYPTRYFVAPGQSARTRHGLIGAFQQVKPQDFSSSEDFESHLRRGLITEK